MKSLVVNSRTCPHWEEYCSWRHLKFVYESQAPPIAAIKPLVPVHFFRLGLIDATESFPFILTLMARRLMQSCKTTQASRKGLIRFDIYLNGINQ